MQKIDILAHLPYSEPFLFVDEIKSIDDNGVVGCFTFHADLDFYKGHFKYNPVTPGVILIETMAQIGLVCLGIYLLRSENIKSSFVLTSSDVEFLKPVYPNEKVTVISKKLYFRFGKLKCTAKMINAQNEVVCEGTIAGIQI